MSKYRKIFAAGCAGICLMALCTGVVEASSKENTKLPELRIGCEEYEPYNYTDENGSLVGIDADIADEACARMGYEPVYIVMEWNQRDSLLKSETIDCIWDCYSINGREEKYQWSDPYLYNRESVLVKKDSNIYSIKELDGKTVSVQSDTRTEELFLNKDIQPGIIASNIYGFPEMEEAVSALRLGYVDAVAGDREFLVRAMEDSDEYRILNKDLETSELAVAFRKDEDQELVKKLNSVLKEMKEDGTIKEILEKYDITEAKIPGEETEIEK